MMVGGAKSCLDSNPIPARDTRRAKTKPCVHQDPETTQRLSQTCVSVSCRGMGEQWPAAGARALGEATWVMKYLFKYFAHLLIGTFVFF